MLRQTLLSWLDYVLSQEDDEGSRQVELPERRLGEVGPIAEEDEEMVDEEEVEEGRAEDQVPIAAVLASISCSCGIQQQDAHMLVCEHCSYISFSVLFQTKSSLVWKSYTQKMRRIFQNNSSLVWKEKN